MSSDSKIDNTEEGQAVQAVDTSTDLESDADQTENTPTDSESDADQTENTPTESESDADQTEGTTTSSIDRIGNAITEVFSVITKAVKDSVR